MKKLLLTAAFAFGISVAGVAHAAIIWTDWTTQSAATGTVTGTVTGVGVTYSGGFSSAQTDGTGIDYWNGTGFTGPWLTTPATTPPPGRDIITLIDGGTKTITFAQPVTDVYMAFLSWNGNAVTFDHAFSVLGQGRGYNGTGTFVTNPTSTGFTSDRLNEVHGILKFSGTFSSLSWTDIRENSRGFQIGVGGVAPPVSAVPEPASWALLLCGFGAIGGTLRSRRRRSVFA